MILCIQLILICVLTLILTALYIDERRKRATKIPRGRLTRVWDGSERRRFIRIPCEVSVRYSPTPKRQNNLNNGKTKDISVGGICMTISEKLTSHARLVLEIECGAPGDPISANGEVIWIRENAKLKNEDGIRYFDVGIEFRDILPEDRDRLFKFIKESKPIQDGQGQSSRTC